jgi:2-polyprenyl-3-methyl-5-hydroxy-6-metoxy-1,4-benzoquinol methylase
MVSVLRVREIESIVQEFAMRASKQGILTVDELGLLSGKTSQPGMEDWPAGGLERVAACPVCESAGRELLYRDLEDRVFFSAPGQWTLYRCRDCGSAYLDPRPNVETIGLAYRNYLTHLSTRSLLNASGLLARARRALGNGYRNYRFGTKDQPASVLGIVFALMFPNLRAIANSAMRNLPRPPRTGGRLLDVGCGNGEFLYRASSLGWDAVGVDIDEASVRTCRDLGLNVRVGSIDVLDHAKEQFDGITLSHVIEHMHAPLEALRSCYCLLKPGGWIWLDTPNLDSSGHTIYKQAWRGLEPPRHLVLFTRDSLCRSLAAMGFSSIEDQLYRPLCQPLFAASQAIASNLNPWNTRRLSGESRKRAIQAERIARTDASSREFATLKAWKTA